MNLDNLIEIMEMLGGELRPVSQWPLSVYNYRALEAQAASLDGNGKRFIAGNSGTTNAICQQLDSFLDEVSWAGSLHDLFFYRFDESSL